MLLDNINLYEVLYPRSIGTFIEILIGALLTPTGFVTDARCMLDMRNHWSSYYKWWQKGKWSWLTLARKFNRFELARIQCDFVHLVIDDTTSKSITISELGIHGRILFARSMFL